MGCRIEGVCGGFGTGQFFWLGDKRFDPRSPSKLHHSLDDGSGPARVVRRRWLQVQMMHVPEDLRSGDGARGFYELDSNGLLQCLFLRSHKSLMSTDPSMRGDAVRHASAVYRCRVFWVRVIRSWQIPKT